jgi:hypothetical protein
MCPHVSGIERVGFFKARRSWEPSSSSTTGKSSPFRTLQKASAVNVHWTDHDTYLSFSQKSSSWHFLALNKPRSTAQVRNHQRISNSWIKADCRLSNDSFLALCSKAIVQAFLATNTLQRDFQRPHAIWHLSHVKWQLSLRFAPRG